VDNTTINAQKASPAVILINDGAETHKQPNHKSMKMLQFMSFFWAPKICIQVTENIENKRTEDDDHRPTRMCKNLKYLQATTKVMNRRSRLIITSQRKGASPSFESCTARRPPLLSHRLLKTLNAFFCGQMCHYTTP
jgi:hypothetical protein